MPFSSIPKDADITICIGMPKANDIVSCMVISNSTQSWNADLVHRAAVRIVAAKSAESTSLSNSVVERSAAFEAFDRLSTVAVPLADIPQVCSGQ